MNIQGWFSLGLTGLISLLSKELKSLLQHHSLKASILLLMLFLSWNCTTLSQCAEMVSLLFSLLHYILRFFSLPLAYKINYLGSFFFSKETIIINGVCCFYDECQRRYNIESQKLPEWLFTNAAIMDEKILITLNCNGYRVNCLIKICWTNEWQGPMRVVRCRW